MGTVHLVFSGTRSRGLTQLQSLTWTDKLHRQAVLGVSPLSSVHNTLLFSFISGPLENSVGKIRGTEDQTPLQRCNNLSVQFPRCHSY